MFNQTTLWIIIVSFLVPICATIGMVQVLRWRRKHFKQPERSPISGKLLRPAGESLRLRIEDLTERFSDQFTFAMILPGAILAGMLLSTTTDHITQPLALFAFATSAALLIYLLRRVFKTREELANYELGFHGERAVAQELNQLMLDGCRVYHDLPIDPYGNIDHVIVSSAGVFAVETKARRKRTAPKGKRDHIADFDGTAVNFPTYRDSQMVDQAKSQAEILSKQLTKDLGEPVAVQAVLTLPGWFIKSTVPPSKVHVLNPKNIHSIALGPRLTQFTPDLIQRISHQLEEKCRTVEL